MRALTRWSVTIPAGLVILLAVSSAGVASGAVTRPPPPPTFMVTDADQGRLQAVGFTGSFTWTMCDPVADGHSCPAGTIRHFANYFTLRGALRAGQRGTFMLDLEGHGSPAYQGATNADRLKYDLEAIGLARHFRVHLIMASVYSSATALQYQLIEAKHGAYGIDIQNQWAGQHPSVYVQIVKRYVAALAAAHVHPKLFANLSTDPQGNPANPANMARAYFWTRRMLTGFWFELPLWITLANGQPGIGCDPQGCPLVGEQFLKDIGDWRSGGSPAVRESGKWGE